MTKELKNKDGFTLLLDDDDYDRLSRYAWRANIHKGSKPYFGRRLSNGNIILIHREILDAPDGFLVDHINGDTCDNRKANLRIATHSQSQQNKGKTLRPTSSQYKGVHLHKGRWVSEIRINKDKRLHLGNFTDEKEAAKAYDDAARLYHGEFARTNF